MAGHDWADDPRVDGGCVDRFQPDDGGYSPNAYSACSESSGEIAVDVAPRVTADWNTPEWEEQMRALARWKINKRHAQCANCQGSRAAGGDGRCRWCGSHVCSEDCFREHDVKCGERPPVDGGRNPEGGVEALEPSHWRETPSTPIFRAFEALEVVAMLKRRVEQRYGENPAPGGYPVLLSRCNLASMLHDCAEEVSRGRVGRLLVERFQRMGEDRGPPTPPPPEYPPPSPRMAGGSETDG